MPSFFLYRTSINFPQTLTITKPSLPPLNPNSPTILLRHISPANADMFSGGTTRQRRSSSPESGRKRKITDEELKDYIEKKVMRVAKKLNREFVWRKKIERDVIDHGVPLHQFSFKVEKQKPTMRMAEIDCQIKNRKAYTERKQREFHPDHVPNKVNHPEPESGLESNPRSEPKPENKHHEGSTVKDMKSYHCPDMIASDDTEVFGPDHEVNLDFPVNWYHDKIHPRKPRYFNRIHTGYKWNRYNRTHYDHENPPPKMVKGYRFNIYYPDLVDKSKIPTYLIEKDGDSVETCIIRFHGGPPYEDIAFRIVNNEWDYARKRDV